MIEIIRQVRKDEWEAFMRFLERSYGHKRGFFPEHYPYLYRPEEEYLQCFHIIERDGEIVSHVGLFPLEVVADEVKIILGGIGGVATLPEKRGKGYMGKLLQHVIEEMQSRNWSLSVLWGARQRYRNFGWEVAGEKVLLHLTERSLARGGIDPSIVREILLEEAQSKVIELNHTQRFRVDRGKKDGGVLRRAGNRIWIGADGYLCGQTADDKLMINEVVSPSGKESSLIKAVMEWCFVREAEVTMRMEDTERFNRLMKIASYWNLTYEGMFRINNCFELLKLFTPILEKRASKLNLKDFSISLGLRSGEEVDIVAINYINGVFRISKEKIEPYIEIDERDGVRLLIGGPFPERGNFGEISALLPLPIHIPNLDQV